MIERRNFQDKCSVVRRSYVRFSWNEHSWRRNAGQGYFSEEHFGSFREKREVSGADWKKRIIEMNNRTEKRMNREDKKRERGKDQEVILEDQ